MKTSFQRKINYSKVFHCRRAEDFHRWWSLLLYFCCSCRPAFSHFICVAGHSYFLPCRVWCYFLCVHFFFIFCIVRRTFQLQATLDGPSCPFTLSAHFLVSLFCLPAAFKCENSRMRFIQWFSHLDLSFSFLAAIAHSFSPFSQLSVWQKSPAVWRDCTFIFSCLTACIFFFIFFQHPSLQIWIKGLNCFELLFDTNVCIE